MKTQIENYYNSHVTSGKHIYASLNQVHASTFDLEVVGSVTTLQLTHPNVICKFLPKVIKVTKHQHNETRVIEIPYEDIYSMFTYKVSPNLDLKLEDLVQFSKFPEDFTNFVSIGIKLKGGRYAQSGHK